MNHPKQLLHSLVARETNEAACDVSLYACLPRRHGGILPKEYCMPAFSVLIDCFLGGNFEDHFDVVLDVCAGAKVEIGGRGGWLQYRG